MPPRPTTLTSYSRRECSACPISLNVTNGVPWLILRTLTVLMFFLHRDTHLTASLGDFLQPQAHYSPVLIGTDTKESGFPSVGGNSTPVPARETTKPADVDCKCPIYLCLFQAQEATNWRCPGILDEKIRTQRGCLSQAYTCQAIDSLQSSFHKLMLEVHSKM